MKQKPKKNTQALYLFNIMRIAGVAIVLNTSIIVLLRMMTPLYALLGACLQSDYAPLQPSSTFYKQDYLQYDKLYQKPTNNIYSSFN
jgi:hypothetical protein